MHAFLFDIDGTLLSSGGAGKDAMYDAIASEFRVSELHDRVAFAGRTDRAIARDLFAAHGIEDSPDNFRRFVACYLSHLPRSLEEKQGRVLPGVAALLEHLAARPDVLVGLLTGNLRDGAQTKLAHFGIFHHFRFGGFGDEHFDRNDVGFDAMRALEEYAAATVRAENVWVVGDTPLDIRCARAIGARVLAVATGLHLEHELRADGPDVLAADLSDGIALVNSMLARRPR